MQGQIGSYCFEWSQGDEWSNEYYDVKGMGCLSTDEMINLVGENALTDWLYDAVNEEYNEKMAYREWASQRL